MPYMASTRAFTQSAVSGLLFLDSGVEKRGRRRVLAVEDSVRQKGAWGDKRVLQDNER
jgi:hypothetical protein